MILFLHGLQIPIATSGIRSMGYLMRHSLSTDEFGSLSQRIIPQFVKVKQQVLDVAKITKEITKNYFTYPLLCKCAQ